MKKTIPEKIANKVYDKVLSGTRYSSSRVNGWVEETLYKPDTTKISNKFFKNKVTLFTYKCRCSWGIKGKRHSTTKKLLNTQEQINGYL